ncbi:MAG: hypothetical protein LBP63_05580 [Prevotellaceae bacterium]|nr:hypothetical protein [Prevotellaceae bacterium]
MQKVQENAAGLSYLIKVEQEVQKGSSIYFLSLWVDGKTTLERIDSFLRDIWLECCGHLSSFTDPKKRRHASLLTMLEAEELLEQNKIKEYEKIMENEVGEIPMSRKASKVFNKGSKLEYQYDFGSTTSLVLTAIDEYPMRADQPIVLLSRNEPLELLCDTCKKEPATQLCIVHEWEGNYMFCDKCAKKHAKRCEDFENYAAMPVVNSPRMGVCGYDGGHIDTERDGIFVKKH